MRTEASRADKGLLHRVFGMSRMCLVEKRERMKMKTQLLLTSQVKAAVFLAVFAVDVSHCCPQFSCLFFLSAWLQGLVTLTPGHLAGPAGVNTDLSKVRPC